MSGFSSSKRNPSATFLICAGLILLFSIVAWTAVAGKSPTADEPGHAEAGWFALWRHDYRIWQNSPPLWEYWIALPTAADAIRFDPTSRQYQTMVAGPVKPFWDRINLPRMIVGARAMSLILAAALAAVIGWWAWELAGPVAAIAATFVYCLDPNFLGQGPLVTSDVAFSLFYLLAVWAIWRATEELSWKSLAAVAISIAAAMEMKFSGPLLGLVLILVLGCRALSKEPWKILNREVHRRATKLTAVSGVCLLSGIITWATMWASYGFRFDAGPDGLTLSMQPLVHALNHYALAEKLHREPTETEIAACRPPLITRAILFAESHRFIPQGWAAGFLFTQIADQGEQGAYLLGRHYLGGRWYYFPLAALFKEPLATLAAAGWMLAIGIRVFRPSVQISPKNRRAAVAIGAAIMVYGCALITADMNVGFRHAFPILPLLFIGIGVAVAQVWHFSAAKKWVVILAGLLFAETAAAYPNYIAFFNLPSSFDRSRLLADSNLDWGQDLPLLAAWQRAHPDQILYLQYFGPADPRDYRIRYVNVLDKTPDVPRVQVSGVLAVSATFLQMEQYNAASMRVLGVSAHDRPIAVLGGTIYLFNVDFARSAAGN